MDTPTLLAVVGGVWLSVVLFVLAIGRAAARPTPEPPKLHVVQDDELEALLRESPRWLDDRDPPHPSRRR